MSEAGEKYLKELTEATKANRAATFALLGHLRDVNKKLTKYKAPIPKLPWFSRCSSCGQDFYELEDDLHHTHYTHPEILGAEHCPCKFCQPPGCECRYCAPSPDEFFGIPDDEVGTTKSLI